MAKWLTANVRFGATATVTPQKMTCEHERKQPAERAVKAAAAPSHQPLAAMRGGQCVKSGIFVFGVFYEKNVLLQN